jgi:hypothetical protein
LATDCHFAFGANNLKKLDRDSQVIQVNQFILHPTWNPHELQYKGDIALAILRSTVEYNNFIRPICLPAARSNSQDIENQWGFVAGWGAFFQLFILFKRLRLSRKLSQIFFIEITANFPRFFETFLQLYSRGILKLFGVNTTASMRQKKRGKLKISFITSKTLTIIAKNVKI